MHGGGRGFKGERRQTAQSVARRRFVARALALIWAGWWTVVLMVLAFPVLRLGYGSLRYVSIGKLALAALILALLVSISWVSVLFSWRQEALGGILLVLEGLLLAIVSYNVIAETLSAVPVLGAIRALLLLSLIALSLALPPLVAGLLLFTSWQRSRPAKEPRTRR